MSKNIEKSVIKTVIRPQKVAFLVPTTMSEGDFRELLDFIGSLWGGRYLCIVPFDLADEENELGMHWLVRYSPDIILYADGSCCTEWVAKIKESINPLKILHLQHPLSENFRINYAGLLHFWPVIKSYVKDVRSLPDTSTRYQFLSTDLKINHQIFYNLSFGVVSKENSEYLADILRGDSVHVSDGSIPNFINLHSNEKRPFTYLDASAKEISTTNAFDCHTHTIFVLSRSIIDYAWFWNNRSKFEGGANSYVIIPSDSLNDIENVEALASWLKGYHVGRANYCKIISISATKAELNTLARKLRPRVSKFGYKHIDVELPDKNNLPMFGLQHKSFETDTVWLGKHSFEFTAPAPSFIDELEERSSSSWMVEIEGGNSLKKHSPPQVCFQTNIKLLNTPSLASLSYSFGGGFSKRYSNGGIATICNNKKVSQSVTLPTIEEFLKPFFHKLGIKYGKDEKQLCYRSVIKLFGGLNEFTETCKEKRYDILAAFWSDKSLPCEKGDLSLSKGCSLKRSDAPVPVSLNKIKQRANIGKEYQKTFQEDSLGMNFIEDEIIAAAAKKRISSSKGFYRQLTPKAFIFWLVEMKVLRQVFHYPQCQSCNNDSDWSVKVDLESPLFCSRCGSNIAVPEDKLEIGYQLNPLVYKAFEEGIRPVALTLQVLQKSVHSGFEYMPGFKGSYNSKGFDIDIIASCDGELVFCECKNMAGASIKAKGWIKIREQLETLIEKAALCGAKSVVLASLTDKYPKLITDVAKKKSSSELRVVLLNKEALLRGYVKSKLGGMEECHASFTEAFLPHIRDKRRKRKGERTISFGSMVESK